MDWARRHSSDGESCSIARHAANSSNSLAAAPAAGADFQPRKSVTASKWSVRVCSRAPWHASTPGSTFNRAPSRATATGGAALTSSSTNPSHGNVHSTAKPKPCAGPLARREATNSTSAGVNVKNLISSSCPMSGNPRN